jgi:hypothetical protein
LREGIHLGPPPGRLPGVVRAVVVLALVALGIQAVWYARERSRIAELRSLLLVPPPSSTADEPSGDSGADVLSELHAATLVGAVDMMPPTAALRFVATVLPDGIVLTSLDFDATRQARLTLAAVAKNASDVSALQGEVEDSPLVLSTELLEERRMASGELSIRLQVELSQVGPR